MSDKGEGDGEDEDVSNAEPRRIKLSPSRASSIVAIKSKTWIAYYPTHPPSNPSPPQTHHHGSGKHAPPLLSLDAGDDVPQRVLRVAALRSPGPPLVHFNSTAGHSADGDHPTPSSSTSPVFSSVFSSSSWPQRRLIRGRQGAHAHTEAAFVLRLVSSVDLTAKVEYGNCEAVRWWTRRCG
jgi:hypothetical protein